MAKTEKESKTQAKAIKLIRKYGGYVYKNQQGMFTEKGRPDLTACIPITVKRFVELFGEDAVIGLFVGIEVKREGKLGEVSEAQYIVGRQIKNAYGLWLAIDDPDIVEALMIKFTGGING